MLLVISVFEKSKCLLSVQLFDIFSPIHMHYSPTSNGCITLEHFAKILPMSMPYITTLIAVCLC